MMHPDATELNEYVDGTATPAGRAATTAHLEECPECRTLVADLRELKERASSLGVVPPPARVWSRIESALESSAPARSRTRWWVGLAAAAVLAIAVGVGVFVSRRPPAPPNTAAAVESELAQAEAHYENAIKGLEQIATSGEAALDPATAATLQRNLAVVDQAIAESRAAVRAQPTSEPAQASLLENIKAKLAFLEDTVALINEARKGNGAAAARIASRMNKG
jgi:hypothetical protein